eukprot:TRINITY_DN45710_c0_g1_i2.p2 TRINITY_DN45710_c0_g1~~TRINITY_DN45710_c0_g1_i2.p2  ORF type:complete len:131 (-),score=22.79 TRINITY_DN45710_c0_g1_i2:24-416(-)
MKVGYGKNKRKKKLKQKNNKEVGIKNPTDNSLKANNKVEDVEMIAVEEDSLDAKDKIKNQLQRKMALKAQIRALKKTRQKVSKLPKKGPMRQKMQQEVKQLVEELKIPSQTGISLSTQRQGESLLDSTFS